MPDRACGDGVILAAFYKYVTAHLSGVIFEEATDLVDNIKGIKSEEEIELIRETCEIQDGALEYALTRIQPGRRDFEIYADIRHKCMQLGSE
jgi:Xaa-Pro aminopeptidase